MIKIKKSYFIFVTIIFLISTLAVFAVQEYKELKVYYRNIKIFVNNEQLKLEDEPFIYNDRVYLPIRFVSEALKSQILWDDKHNAVSIFSFKDFEETKPLEGERFVYGEILSIDKENMTIDISQHLDDNTAYEDSNLKVSENVIIILQRNNRKINLVFEDLRIGDIVGMVINKENEVRGIIIDA